MVSLGFPCFPSLTMMIQWSITIPIEPGGPGCSLQACDFSLYATCGPKGGPVGWWFFGGVIWGDTMWYYQSRVGKARVNHWNHPYLHSLTGLYHFVPPVYGKCVAVFYFFTKMIGDYENPSWGCLQINQQLIFVVGLGEWKGQRAQHAYAWWMHFR